MFCAFLFSHLSRYFFLAEIVNTFRLQLAIGLLPLPFLLWRFQLKVASLILGLIACWTICGIAFSYLPVEQPVGGKKQVTIMSFNVFGRNMQVQDTLELIEGVDPDVVLILEYANHWHAGLAPLNETYPYRSLHPRWHGFGIAVFSKYPISQARVFQLTRETVDVPFLQATVNLGEQELMLMGVHTISPTNKFRFELRNRQLEEIADLIETQPNKSTIVMGDFNAVPWSPFVLDLKARTGLRDSRDGFGYQASWHTFWWPLRVPIDQALVSNNIHVHRRWIGKDVGSDHFPLITTVSIANENAGGN